MFTIKYEILISGVGTTKGCMNGKQYRTAGAAKAAATRALNKLFGDNWVYLDIVIGRTFSSTRQFTNS